MNIKKLASLLFQRSVIVALLIFLQAAMLLLYMLWFSSDFIYVYWGCVVLSILAVLIIVSRQTDPGYKIAWIIPILLFPAFGWLVYLLCGGNKLSARKRRKMQGMDRTMLEQLERDYKAEEPAARSIPTPIPTIFPWGMMCFPPCWRSCGRRKSISSWNTSLLAPAYSGILWWRF